MGREIKFRLHDKECRVIGYEIHEKNEHGCWQIYHTSLREDWSDGNTNKLVREGYFIAATHKCQYTGLKDKNGKEIYEGDILKSWYSRDMSGKDIIWVTFEVEHQVSEGSGTSGFQIEFLDKAEIIGSIYENPELLK